MFLFVLAAGGILAYGATYARFCIKKGGIAAALPIFILLAVNLGLLLLLLYFRTNT